MLVSEKHRKVVLNLRDPARVTTVVPTAKTFEYKGRTLVAVPHDRDEVKVLHNLGIKAPEPVRHYYKWPGQFAPFHAQRETAAMLTMEHHAYVLNDLGTGKSMAVLWSYDYLRAVGALRRMLVVAPLSTLDDTWLNTVHGQFFHLNAVVLHGTRERRLRLLKDDYDVYIINHDGLKGAGIVDAIRARGDIDLVVLDELAVFRNTGTDRWKAADALCNPRLNKKTPLPRPWVWGLTGTPMPNAPTDAFAQCRLVTPHTVPQYFGRFRDMVMNQRGPYTWLPRDNAIEIVHRAMAPAVRFSMEDCVDLPEQLFQTREVGLSPEQERAYNDMLRKLKAEYDGGQITAANEAVKASKLVQICCGAAYTNDGSAALIPATPRLAELEETIEQASAKVIVFVPFTEALAQVAEHLSRRWGVLAMHGEVSRPKRAEVFSRFKRDASVRILVAEPRTMSHGLTLTDANVIVWFAPPTSNETYQQANGRIRRPGQTRTTLIVHMCGSAIERKMYARLAGKQKMQGELLDLFKEGKDTRLTA
jgi:SNF2 family DNA or RNA helicase